MDLNITFSIYIIYNNLLGLNKYKNDFTFIYSPNSFYKNYISKVKLILV